MKRFKELAIGQRFFVGKNVYEKIETMWGAGMEYNAVCRDDGWRSGELRWFDSELTIFDGDLVNA